MEATLGAKDVSTEENDMVVETTDNRLYDVGTGETPRPGMPHVWFGIAVKRAKGGTFVPKAGKAGKVRTEVRIKGSKIIAYNAP